MLDRHQSPIISDRLEGDGDDADRRGILPTRVAPGEAQQMRAVGGQELPAQQDQAAGVVDVESDSAANVGFDDDGDAPNSPGHVTPSPPTTFLISPT